MGRYAKNQEIKTASYSIRVPVGSNSLAADNPVDGLFRYNQDTKFLEYYSGNSWQQVEVGGQPLRRLVKDTFTGDGTNRFFGPMFYSYSPGEEIFILVFIGNVFQNPGVAYRVNNDIIEFTSPPPEGHSIVLLHGVAK